MLRKLFEVTSQEEIIDEETGNVYIHTEGDYRGHEIEINQDLIDNRVGRFHARADRNNATTKSNMDEGGLIGWLRDLFGG